MKYSFADGGKDGHPYPVNRKVYDETINIMEVLIRKSKIEHSDREKAFSKLKLFIKS